MSTLDCNGCGDNLLKCKVVVSRETLTSLEEAISATAEYSQTSLTCLMIPIPSSQQNLDKAPDIVTMLHNWLRLATNHLPNISIMTLLSVPLVASCFDTISFFSLTCYLQVRDGPLQLKFRRKSGKSWSNIVKEQGTPLTALFYVVLGVYLYNNKIN